MRGVARVGDKVICHRCKKAGHILTGSHTHLIDGRPIARLGDLTTCGPIVTGSHTHLIDGRPIARLGDLTGCCQRQHPKEGCGGHIITASLDYLWE